MVNMTNGPNNVQLSLPITEEAIAIAQHFARQQPNARKAEQIRLNTLAVSVVDHYLQMMSIQTDAEASDSRNPFVCLGADVADLMVSGLGRLECRPIRTDQPSCHVPFEVWEDRIGYVAVQLDETLEEAVLIGFTPAVREEDIPRNQFQPVQTLLRRLHELSPVATAATLPTESAAIKLNELLQGMLVTGWQTLEELLLGTEGNLAYARTKRLDAESVSNTRRMGKLVNLEHLEERQVILLAESKARYFTSSFAADSALQDVEIAIRVIPANRQQTLPAGLQLLLLDDSDTVVEQIEANPNDDYLRIPIVGKRGEQFGVRIVLADSSRTEYFVI